MLRATLAAAATLAALTIAATTGNSQPLQLNIYSGDSNLSIPRIVHTTRAAAEAHGHTGPATLDLRVVAEVPDNEHGFIGGLQSGDTVWVRSNVADPARVVLHEAAHAFVGGYNHGQEWRDVYLEAGQELFGGRFAELELRRIRWVYDKCYLDESC